MIEAGRYRSIDELVAAEKINASCVSRLPILDRQLPDGMTLPVLMAVSDQMGEKRRAFSNPGTYTTGFLGFAAPKARLRRDALAAAPIRALRPVNRPVRSYEPCVTARYWHR
ncbi:MULTISPECIES: hypothetical protein [Roseomonadaceae]|uniref:Uncharacterized protein n=1 Tax=Falsiroseomonas oleicola TaxID=2801474 RepID=A0ABS6HAR0_9PROT|nr:hypothetical protein [Roseomonas oleicola]MBU8545812.1 hypothetical protein [Roseomonas oleicola]